MSAGGQPPFETLSIRPYARLLTMLGEQLIKNDRIALVELIKNSYDADASHVSVNFVGLPNDPQNADESSIEIVDDGTGMSEETIRKHWLNPATPGKAEQKRKNPRTNRGRIVQGEKGIGRFAIFKLGKTATVVTRGQDSDDEFVLEYDLSFLNDEARDNDDLSMPTFIDQIPVRLARRPPVVFDGKSSSGLASAHGTRLVIGDLRSTWTNNAIENVYEDVARLQPLVPLGETDKDQDPTQVEPDFLVTISQDGIQQQYGADRENQLRILFDERAVLRVSGNYSEDDMAFSLNVNGHDSLVKLDDPVITGLRTYGRYFDNSANPRSPDNLECGSFDFKLFIFDLTPSAPVEHKLDPDERRLVKEHRIYLYRDDVRVLPYGDADDDWLQLDVIRGTQGASRVLSNDQTVGFVFITQEGNPELRDKTNREGLLETGNAYADFVALLQLVIVHLRRGEFRRYLLNKEHMQEVKERSQRPVDSAFQRLLARTDLPESIEKEIRELEKAYAREKQMFQTRATRTEDLAGVGLSVEAASHDIVATANLALRHARTVSGYVASNLPNEKQLLTDATSVVDALSFVSSRLQDIQGLFVSTRQRRRPVQLVKYVERVASIYAALLKKNNTELEIKADKPPLLVKATDAALLQVLINLFDNSLYWLNVTKAASPKIHVTIDTENETLLFADNGPGVNPDDVPYIFEPFYSGKGEEGKGLGLYIARQVGARSGFSIDLVTDGRKKSLSGANFLVSFAEAGNDD